MSHYLKQKPSVKNTAIGKISTFISIDDDKCWY